MMVAVVETLHCGHYCSLSSSFLLTEAKRLEAEVLVAVAVATAAHGRVAEVLAVILVELAVAVAGPWRW